MLNNDDRQRLIREADHLYSTTSMVESLSDDTAAVVDYLWQEFDRMTTPRPRHDDDLAGLAARENASTTDEDEPVNRESMYSRYRTLLGTVSGLRAELAATLRRLDGLRESLRREQDAHSAVMRDLETAREDAERYKGDHQRACETIAAMYEAGTGRKGQGPIRGVVEDVEDERARAHRDVKLAEAVAEQYRRDATDSALRLRRIQQIVEADRAPEPAPAPRPLQEGDRVRIAQGAKRWQFDRAGTSPVHLAKDGPVEGTVTDPCDPEGDVAVRVDGAVGTTWAHPEYVTRID